MKNELSLTVCYEAKNFVCSIKLSPIPLSQFFIVYLAVFMGLLGLGHKFSIIKNVFPMIYSFSSLPRAMFFKYNFTSGHVRLSLP